MKAIELKDTLDRLADHALENKADPQEIVRQLEKRILITALALEGGNQVKAAARLGHHRNTISRHMDEFNIPRPQGRRPQAWLSKTS